jgi:hypothetical protein
MKHMAQFAAVVVVALLVGFPAAQVLTCPLRASTISADCPLGVNTAAPECPMSHQVAANECLRDCCNCGLPKLVGPTAGPLHLKPGTPVQFVALDASGRDAAHGAAATPDVPTVTSSPPRYILNRVFRI